MLGENDFGDRSITTGVGNAVRFIRTGAAAGTTVNAVPSFPTPSSDSDGTRTYVPRTVAVSSSFQVQRQTAGVSTTLPFIVRTVIPEVNGVIEAYAVDALPAGDYSATLTRVTTDGEGNDVERVSAAAAVSIGSGTNTPQDFTLP